jgi:hypothetical protein
MEKLKQEVVKICRVSGPLVAGGDLCAGGPAAVWHGGRGGTGMDGEGHPALPDHQLAPWPHDGGAQWLRQVHCLEGAAQGPGEARGCRGRGTRHRPEGPQ